jgi:hypothetical protein
VAGLFLFLPLLARLRLDQLVGQAGYPGSRMIPAVSALLSLLSLKLLDKERHSHISDFDFDEALGLFAGLNILPKRSYASDYSYRTQRCHQHRLLSGWGAALAPLLFPEGRTFCVDFHPIPHRGEATALDNHFVSTRGQACPSVLGFFAQEHGSRVLCYANANLSREEQAGEVMRFVEFWHETTGHDPHWLYLDSKVTTYVELNRVNQRDIQFITIRRRGAAMIRRLRGLPATSWRRAVIDVPKRRHQHIRFVDETVHLKGYDKPLRQVAVDGLGREQPTLLLTNNSAETARALIVRYAGRNRIEGGLGQCVNFFHLDCLASDVPLNVDLDVALTVLANGCYCWLARQLRGYDKAQAKQLYRKFVETAGVVEVGHDEIVVRFDKRAHNPILRVAALDHHSPAVPWLQGRALRFAFP